MSGPSPDPNTFAFATPQDVQNNWEAFTTNQQTAYCQTLLNSAGLWIRGKKPGIPDSDPGAWLVSIDVVRERLKRDGFPAIHSGTHAVDGKSDSWSAPRTASVEELAKTLVFSDYQLQLLGLFAPTAPTAQFGNALRSIDPIIIGGGDVDIRGVPFNWS